MPSLQSQLLISLFRCFRALLALSLFILHLNASAQAAEQPASLAVLDFGKSTFGRMASDRLAGTLTHEAGLTVLDRDQVRAAAAGIGYEGSINLSVSEARDLGAALGGEFFIVGDAQILRRSPSTGSVYFESYASIFLVSSRSGRLIHWERPSVKVSTALVAQQSLLTELSKDDRRQRLVIAMRRAREEERGERELITGRQIPVIEEAPGDDRLAEAEGLRLPRPFRRITPTYPESAANAEAEATVDVLVDLDAEGEVKRVEVARWAGFGLDQATIETVRRLHFFPAMREGVAIPIRVLLRYNFRKPPR
jgi:TonB family protein